MPINNKIAGFLLGTGGKTPTMAVDDSDLDITLKTPPNVRKIKSRSNSTATPRQQGSIKISEAAISKNLMKKRKLAMKPDVNQDRVIDQEAVEIDTTKQNLSAKAKVKGKQNNLLSSLQPKQKLLTPVIKSRAEKPDSAPKMAKQASVKSRRRSEPLKKIA